MHASAGASASRHARARLIEMALSARQASALSLGAAAAGTAVPAHLPLRCYFIAKRMPRLRFILLSATRFPDSFYLLGRKKPLTPPNVSH